MGADHYYFHNLPAEKQNQILDYELSIYVCDGDPGEKLDWFKIINIAGEKLTDQELRNAIYTGPWLADAKRWFSKTGCPAYQIGEKYVNGSPIRQEFLETALEWITGGEGEVLERYMAEHQPEANASELWQHFQKVVSWVEQTFPVYRSKMMKGRNWGRMYREHGARTDLNAMELEERIKDLIENDEVTSQRGIYEYLLTGNEKTLSLRQFDDKVKQRVYDRQAGVCMKCKKTFQIHEMHADHITPWHKGGKTEEKNCVMLCAACNMSKGGT